jgi:undecaprenyl diphosphate synthase
MPSQPPSSLPKHIAFIMDGNGRWAAARSLPRLAGHKAGVDAVRRTLEACKQRGIGTVTLYAFSTENWQRPTEEVDGLMGLLRFYLKSELARMHEEGVRLVILGDRTGLPTDLQDMVTQAETLTANNIVFTLCIAINYGGRQEIARAAQAAAASGQPITQESIAAHLYTAAVPDPDLIIRTSGERRISNFLLWQAAYAELYFTPTHWPDFDAAELDKALADYAERQRRFGGLPDKVTDKDRADSL